VKIFFFFFFFFFFFLTFLDLVAVLHLNDPDNAVNMGNAAFNECLPKLWTQLQHDDAVKAIVLFSEKPGNFIAGADIGMLARCKTPAEATALSRAGQVKKKKKKKIEEKKREERKREREREKEREERENREKRETEKIEREKQRK
jgi:enoyl-CoA hydratase/carnithine racemase